MLLASQAKRWVFTLNNPTDEEKLNVHLLGESISADGDQSFLTYLIFGEEVGDNGTPHLQGYMCLRTKARIPRIKEEPGLSRTHLEVARGTHAQASVYCKKDGQYYEFGTAPPKPGAGAQWEQLRDWVASQDPAPTIMDVWETFPSLAARNKSAVLECIAIFGKRSSLVDGPFIHLWQHRLDSIVGLEPDDRRINFVVDPEGNKGKSWLCRHWISHRGGTQFMSVGKRDDLAYAVDVTADLFVFDIPRGNMQYCQYAIFEQLKNRLIFSNKYQSQMKILPHNVHVVVFSNEAPDMNALTADRYKIINI